MRPAEHAIGGAEKRENDVPAPHLGERPGLAGSRRKLQRRGGRPETAWRSYARRTIVDGPTGSRPSPNPRIFRFPANLLIWPKFSRLMSTQALARPDSGAFKPRARSDLRRRQLRGVCGHSPGLASSRRGDLLGNNRDSPSWSSRSFFPIAALPMYTRLALGTGPMLVQTLALAVLVQAMPAAVPLLGLQVLVGGVWSAHSLVGDPRGRGSVVTAGTAAGMASAAVFLLLSATRRADAGPRRRRHERRRRRCARRRIAPRAQSRSSSGMFGHVTPLTLIEALSYDHPLLRRLITQAPGTFLHSTNLAILSDAAARRDRRECPRRARWRAVPRRGQDDCARRTSSRTSRARLREDRRSIEEIAQQPRAARVGRRGAHPQLRAGRHHRAVRARAPRHVADAVAARAPGQRQLSSTRECCSIPVPGRDPRKPAS